MKATKPEEKDAEIKATEKKDEERREKAAGSQNRPKLQNKMWQKGTFAKLVSASKATLPPGWQITEKTRQDGETKGRKDTYYISPEGKVLRSKAEVAQHIKTQKKKRKDTK